QNVASDFNIRHYFLPGGLVNSQSFFQVFNRTVPPAVLAALYNGIGQIVTNIWIIYQFIKRCMIDVQVFWLCLTEANLWFQDAIFFRANTMYICQLCNVHKTAKPAPESDDTACKSWANPFYGNEFHRIGSVDVNRYCKRLFWAW